MIEWRNFLACILERPHEDGPRLVAADWLEEQGDGERAEFIRVQVELADENNCRCWPENTPCVWCEEDKPNLRRRERELLANVHSGDWLGALGKNGCTWPGAFDHVPTGEVAFSLPSGNPNAPSGVVGIFHRGFIDSISLSWLDWLAHADAIRESQPVTRVRLTTWPDQQTWITGWRNVEAQGAGNASEVGNRVIARLAAEWPGIAFELPPPVYQPNADGMRGVMFPGTSVAATSTITYPEIPEPPPAAPRRTDNQANYSRQIEYGRRGRRR